MAVMLAFLITLCVVYAVVQPPESTGEEDRRDAESGEEGRFAGQLIALDRAVRRLECAPRRAEKVCEECEPEALLKPAG